MPPAKGEGMLAEKSAIVAYGFQKANKKNSAGQAGEAFIAGSWAFLSGEGFASG
jgi:hypothetical protein